MRPSIWMLSVSYSCMTHAWQLFPCPIHIIVVLYVNLYFMSVLSFVLHYFNFPPLLCMLVVVNVGHPSGSVNGAFLIMCVQTTQLLATSPQDHKKFIIAM